MQLARAAGLGQELGAEADQAARRDDLLDANPAGAVVDHLLHAALADAEHLDDDAGVLLGHVDREALHRLVALAVDHARDDLRLADGQLEALAAHRLDEHGQLQLAAALHLPRVRAVGRRDAQRHVADELLLEALLDHRGGQLLAALADERRRVDADRHRQARLVDGDHGQRAGVLDGGDRLADRHLGDAGDGDDIARPGLIRGHALELLRDVELGQLDVLDRAVGAAPGDGLALAHRAVVDAAEREAAHVRRRVEVGDERLQRMRGIVLRRGHMLEDRVEQRLEVVLQLVGSLRGGVPGACVRVDDREVDLLLGGVEVQEQRVGLVEHLGDARVGTIDLVDHEDHRQLRLERLAQHEARLRQRALAGVDEQHDGVDHRQSALDLAAEVGMAGRVDDVDLRVAVPDRRVLGEDGDALLALEIVRVHDALGDVLVGAEGTRLPQHGVDERRLAVIDVRDDRDVPDRVAAFH